MITISNCAARLAYTASYTIHRDIIFASAYYGCKNHKSKTNTNNMKLYTVLFQVRVEYDDIPPQVFISELNKFIRDHQPTRGFRAEIVWERVVRPENEIDLEERQGK